MWRIAVLIVVALTITIPVQAKQKKMKEYKPSQEALEKKVTGEQRASFGPAERNLIRAHLLGLKHSTSKQGDRELPPGLQKKIARGKTLPSGWQKKVMPGKTLDYHVYRQGLKLPEVLLRRLPPPPIGSEILQVEDKIIRLISATRTILDVFDLTPTR